jgi:hypothetical protein
VSADYLAFLEQHTYDGRTRWNSVEVLSVVSAFPDVPSATA